MIRFFSALDRRVQHVAPGGVGALAVAITLVIGAVDYATGYEVSLSLLYLAPVALAAWYVGRRTGAAIAVVACITWLFADTANGHQYSHGAIQAWNTFVRFGFFAITSYLLDALHASLHRQQELARTDALTGLYGRRAIEFRLRHDLALGQRRKSALTLAYIDLDDFKAVNDTWGHAGGDALLRLVGHVLAGALRAADTPARVGGDEFAVVMPDTDAQEARQILARMTGDLEAALAGEPYDASWSIGVVTFPESDMSPEGAFAAADALMYRVKRSGKGAVAFDVVAANGQTAAT